MIPLVDDYIQALIVEKLKWLKEHPSVIDHIFRTGRRETLAKLRDFIVNKKVKIMIGYPKDQTSLPAYVITLAPEAEQPMGLGDEHGSFEGMDLGMTDEDSPEYLELVEQDLTRYISGTYMNSTYRIECWSDNGDLTSYMYTILKWCLWSSRMQMMDLGWVNVSVSGTDLEPVPEYFPSFFIYRRAAQLAVTYPNLYYENLPFMETLPDILDNPDDFHEDDDGNLVNKEGIIVIPARYSWIVKAHYQTSGITTDITVAEWRNYTTGYNYGDDTLIRIVNQLPLFGNRRTIYLVTCYKPGTKDLYYEQYMWNESGFTKIAELDEPSSKLLLDNIGTTDPENIEVIESLFDK